MEVEIWKDIPDYEGLYQVSNFGNIKTLYFGKEKLLKPQPNSNGYLRVYLYKEKKQKLKYVHQLVASAFISNDNPTEKNEINHLDENKQNNHVSNLCWCNRYENINYGTRNERVSKALYGKHHTEEAKQKISNNKKEYFKDKENHPMYGKHHTEETKQKMSKPILQYTLEGEFIREWENIKQASEELNIKSTNICMCCKGKRNQCGNFIWKYKYPTNN